MLPKKFWKWADLRHHLQESGLWNVEVDPDGVEALSRALQGEVELSLWDLDDEGVKALATPSNDQTHSVSSHHQRMTATSVTSPPTSSNSRLSSHDKNDNHDDDDGTRMQSTLEYLHNKGSLSIDSKVFLQGLNPHEWSATRVNDAAMFLETHHAQERSEHQSTLGELLACNRLLACSRLNRYWMGPHVGTSAQDIPFDTQFLLVELEQETSVPTPTTDTDDDESTTTPTTRMMYALLLPLVDNGFRATLQADDSSHLQVLCAAESGDAAVKGRGMRALYVGTGTDPFAVLQQGFRHVADATQTFRVLSDKKVPSSVDEFGWCTWDAFYSKVTPAGVLQGVEALNKEGVPPKLVILDDGWQQVTPQAPAKEEENEEITTTTTTTTTTTINKQEPKQRWSLLAVILAIVSPLVEKFYESYVRKAPHRSIANQIWRFLAQTVLKGGLWDFFDTTTDFNRQLNGFPANSKFENDQHSLKGLVQQLKGEHGVNHVYCWHALHGYWRGVSEELGRQIGINVINVHPKPSEHMLRLEPQLAWDTVSLFGVGLLSTPTELAKFYDHLHAPLVQAGVDGVKVDVQSGVSAVGGGVGGGPHVAKLYTNAMEDSVAKRFVDSTNGATHCINCMCHSTENLYRYRTTAVARASDDFYPDRPTSHTVHLVNVAYNSLFLGEIALPDWDMFHSKHASASLHAAARAVGGCPVYVSDAPGEHDGELLRRLVLPDGSILRAQFPGRPTRDSLFVDVTADGKSALKVWNQNVGGGGVVGTFHVQGVQWNFDTHENEVVQESPGAISSVVTPWDVETLRNNDGPFVAWRHRSAQLEFLPDGNSALTVELAQPGEWDVIAIAPVETLDNNNNNNNLMWAPIGLSEMFNSGGALIANNGGGRTLEQLSATESRASFECRGPGKFAAFANIAPSQVILNGSVKLDFSHDKETNQVSFQLPKEDTAGKPHQIVIEWDDLA